MNILRRLLTWGRTSQALKRVVVKAAWLSAAVLAVIGAVNAVWFVVSNWAGLGDKTLWNLLQLLIIPVVLAIGAYWFNRLERGADRLVAKNRVKDARIIVDEKRQDDALQEYIKAMTGLVLEQGLRQWGKDGPPNDLKTKYDAVRNVARARTLTVLDGLNAERKASVMQFLVELDLVSGTEDAEPVISLRRANLEKADLRGSDLRGANLSFANLRGADLRGAKVTDEQLSEAKSLKDATMPDGSRYDGRFNLMGEIASAPAYGIDVDDHEEMAQ